jgi:2-hydroxy-3-keto-5-methylthiopentenyl-1-phosphate phosphatase
MSSSRDEPVGLRIYLDFDGTVTGRNGQKTVVDPLFQSLQTNQDDAFYEANFKKDDDVLKLLKDGFQNEANKNMQISTAARDFLLEMLNQKAEIIFISKNREEYIRPLLKLAGLENEQIAGIKIYDAKKIYINKKPDEKKREEPVTKGTFIRYHEKEAGKAAMVVVCDDDPTDYARMRDALKASYSDAQVIGHNLETGKFDWDGIEKEIAAQLQINKDAASDLIDLIKDNISPTTALEEIESQLSKGKPLVETEYEIGKVSLKNLINDSGTTEREQREKAVEIFAKKIGCLPNQIYLNQDYLKPDTYTVFIFKEGLEKAFEGIVNIIQRRRALLDEPSIPLPEREMKSSAAAPQSAPLPPPLPEWGEEPSASAKPAEPRPPSSPPPRAAASGVSPRPPSSPPPKAANSNRSQIQGPGLRGKESGPQPKIQGAASEPHPPTVPPPRPRGPEGKG